MGHKILRPPPLVLIQGGRARNCGDPGRTSNSHLTKDVRSTLGDTSPTVFTFIFVCARGVGFLPLCPFCENEHPHGPFAFSDFLADLRQRTGHSSHCGVHRDWDGVSGGHYHFAISAPAMFAPGQASKRDAQMHMDLLEDEGCRVDRINTLPSRAPVHCWNMRGSGPPLGSRRWR
jgi:hypothetical protein